MNRLKSLFLVILLAGGFAALPLQAQAAKSAKAKSDAQPNKERLVLMPLRLDEADQKLQGAMEMALVKGLQQKYEVFFGEQVAKKAREIFLKESRNTTKKECDETRCLQGIAEAFQAELLATANITKQDGGYFIALSVQNLFDNKVVQSESVACKGCDSFAVIDKLKELTGTPAPTSSSVAAEPEAPKLTATDPDSITWAEAQKGNSADDYQVYINAYPKGKYIAFAKAKLKKLKESAQATAEQQEQQAWDAAQAENSETGYTRYLTVYPAGRFAGFARTRSDKLKTDQAYKTETDLWQKADSGMDRTAVETYLSKYPAGRYIAQASAKLQTIKEEEAKGPAMVKIPGKNYEMGKYEVTQKEWRDIMGNNPSRFTNCGDSCPVEQVSWDDIQIFLQKLNAKTGRQYRLPSEEEWEFACYGGSQSEYCGSSDINAVAWYKGNSNSATHLVGQKQANGYGLYDMCGNVTEWMRSLYNESKPDLGRRLRGGAWRNEPQYVSASFSSFMLPSMRLDFIGFRLARTLP